MNKFMYIKISSFGWIWTLFANKKVGNNGCVVNLQIYYKKEVNALIVSQTRSIEEFDQIVDLNMGYDPKHQKISIISKLCGRKYPKSLQKLVQKFLRVAFKRKPQESGIKKFLNHFQSMNKLNNNYILTLK